MDKLKKALIILTVVVVSGFLLLSQESNNQKLFNLKTAELHLKEIRGDYESAIELKKHGLISELEFSKKATAYLKAQVEYQRALIEFSGAESRLIVQSATKWIDARGKPHARVTISYTNRDIKALQKLGIREDLFPLDFLKDIKDVYISLYSEDYIISDPYQIRIPAIAAEEKKSVDFMLLKDVESLEISIYHGGKQERRKVYLLKDAAANIVTIHSSRFSQEIDLGSEASFDLFLERYSRESTVFKLFVVGLPREIGHEFIDPETDARLSQIKFPEGVTSIKLILKVYLPRNLPGSMAIDSPVRFYALCLDEDESGQLEQAAQDDALTPDIGKLKGGNAALEITPRGIGKIELIAPNLYYESKVDETVHMELTASNTGTRRLDNIKITVDTPLDWKAEILPAFIRQVDQDKEKSIKLQFMPPPQVTVGDYEMKIKAESTSAGKRVESETKIVRIHVSSRANILGTIILIIILVGIVIGIAVFGVRLTRR